MLRLAMTNSDCIWADAQLAENFVQGDIVTSVEFVCRDDLNALHVHLHSDHNAKIRTFPGEPRA
jgi:hypothetical protein